LIQKVELPPMKGVFSEVQALPDNSILVSVIIPTGHNTSIFNSEGTMVRQFSLGPFNDVQVAANGEIWVAYGDQAIFSRYETENDLGWQGLACFDNNGAIKWSFNSLASGYPDICDCYALNVTEDQVWTCYYDEFPISRIDERKQVTTWQNDISGAKAIAVDGNRLLLYGGCDPEEPYTEGNCVIQTLGQDLHAHHSSTYAVELPQESPYVWARDVYGRGAAVHTLLQSKWYQLCLEDLE
jgi:hypothetical protein